MDQTLVSNQVFDKIQEPTEYHSILNGTIIYANKYTGLPKIPMPPDWVDHLDAQGGGIGNNPLIQLEAKLKDMADGPWYIDDRDGILYIHNKDFQADSVHTYVYQQENGEVISVSFSTQSQNGIKTYQSTGMFGSKSLSLNMGGYFGNNHIGTSGSNSRSNSSTYENYASLPEQIVVPTQKQRTIIGSDKSTENAKYLASLGHSIRGYASVDKQIEWQFSRHKKTSAWSNQIAQAVQRRLREFHVSWEDLWNLLMVPNGHGHYKKTDYYSGFYHLVTILLGREPIYINIPFTVYQYEKRELFDYNHLRFFPTSKGAQAALAYIKSNSTWVKHIENKLNEIEFEEYSKGIYLAHDHTWNVSKDRQGIYHVYTDILRKRVITKSYRVYDGATYYSTAIVHMWNYYNSKNRPKTRFEKEEEQFNRK